MWRKVIGGFAGKIVAMVVAVVTAVTSCFCFAACSEEQPVVPSVSDGKVYLTDWKLQCNDQTLLKVETDGNKVSVKGLKIPEDDVRFIYCRIREGAEGMFSLNFTCRASAKTTVGIRLYFDGVAGAYVSKFTVDNAVDGTIALLAGKKLVMAMICPFDLEGANTLVFDEIFLSEYKEKTTIIGSEQETPYSADDQAADSESYSGDSSLTSESYSQSQSGSSQSQSGSSGYNGGDIDAYMYDPYILDCFCDWDYFGNYSGGESSYDSQSATQSTPQSQSYSYEVIDDSPVPHSERLADKYEDYFYIGMAAGLERYSSFTDIEGHFNSFTCENEMKMYTIASNSNVQFDCYDISTYDFSAADEMLFYMRSKGKKIRGHCLIWYYEVPDWYGKCKDKDEFLRLTDTYCFNVVKHFNDKFGDVIYAWDVVNEAVSDNFVGSVKMTQAAKTVFGTNDEGCNELRRGFYGVAGLDYIKTAFAAARRAAPYAKLFYNDYNLIAEHQKLRGVINLVTELIEAGAPIDGVGMQCHLKTMSPSIADNIENVITTINKVSEVTGHKLDIHVTELDVTNNANNDTALANLYKAVFQRLRAYKDDVSSVTFWGVTDEYSWLDNGIYNKAYPFLFDVNGTKKPAFDAVFNF